MRCNRFLQIYRGQIKKFTLFSTVCGIFAQIVEFLGKAEMTESVHFRVCRDIIVIKGIIIFVITVAI